MLLISLTFLFCTCLYNTYVKAGGLVPYCIRQTIKVMQDYSQYHLWIWLHPLLITHWISSGSFVPRNKSWPAQVPSVPVCSGWRLIVSVWEWGRDVTECGQSCQFFWALGWVALSAWFELWFKLFVHLKVKSSFFLRGYSEGFTTEFISSQRYNTKSEKTLKPDCRSSVHCLVKRFSPTFFNRPLEVRDLVTGSRAAKGERSLFCNWAWGENCYKPGCRCKMCFWGLGGFPKQI